jgi:hypothetical protein
MVTMLPDLTPIEWLSIAGFSLALGTFVLSCINLTPSAKARLVAASLSFAIVALGINIVQSVGRAHEVRQLSGRIIEILGNGEKTLDQVQIDLNNPDLKMFVRAFALLDSEGRIDNRLVEVHLTRQQTVQVRLWRAKANR